MLINRQILTLEDGLKAELISFFYDDEESSQQRKEKLLKHEESEVISFVKVTTTDCKEYYIKANYEPFAEDGIKRGFAILEEAVEYVKKVESKGGVSINVSEEEFKQIFGNEQF